MQELMNPTKTTQELPVVSLLLSARLMRCSHQDGTSSWPAAANAGEFTHLGAELTFKLFLPSAPSHSSKDEGQEGVIKPNPVTDDTHISHCQAPTSSAVLASCQAS